MRRIGWIAALLVLVAIPAACAVLVGSASVIDGDTLEIHGRRVRLLGVDAPESSQTCDDRGKPWRCGQQAALALDAKIAQRPVSCSEHGSDRYGRTLAVCSAGGEDLGAWLVAEGWALAYRRYGDTYVSQENLAKTAHKGIWRGAFTAPCDYRASQRAAGSASHAQAPAGPCRIKGNVGANGERIYHLPGSASYAETRINPSKGERYFCTESEAKAAGWRPPR